MMNVYSKFSNVCQGKISGEFLPLIGGDGVGRNHREEKEPFEGLFSENHYTLLILNVILASCAKFQDQRMIKYKVEVYPMLLTLERKQLLIVWYRSIQYSCALNICYYICINLGSPGRYIL